MTWRIVMPAEAALIKWHKQPGERVDRGDLLAEIETDKSVVEVQAEADGFLGEQLVAEGTRAVAEGEAIGTIVASVQAASAAPAPAPASVPTPRPAPAAASASEPAAAAPAREPAPVADSTRGRLFASPRARNLAAEAGLALAGLQGSGPGGRIVERDILALRDRAAPAPRAAAAHAQGTAHRAAPSADVEVVPIDPMRAAIARRLSESKQTVPHFYLSATVELDALFTLRESLNRSSPVGTDGRAAFRLSVNDFIVKALALALQRVPAANTVWDGDRMLRHRASDVGVAIAVEGGLFTPVVRDADRKTLQEISAEVKDFAARAAARRLLPADYQGGTSAVSNLGMYGVESFSAILNPPQSTILAVGQAAQRLVVREGTPVVAQAMSVTLSCDHRVVDGAVGAQLLGAFKALIESPNALRARSSRLDPPAA